MRLQQANLIFYGFQILIIPSYHIICYNCVGHQISQQLQQLRDKITHHFIV